MIHEELQRLERLANQVQKKMLQMEEQNASMARELELLKQSLQEKEQALDHFKNQIKISKIVNNIPVEEVESAEMSNKINSYIKEIDKIITYLSE